MEVILSDSSDEVSFSPRVLRCTLYELKYIHILWCTFCLALSPYSYILNNCVLPTLCQQFVFSQFTVEELDWSD